ncbi:MAG: EamA/RhaT family transporter, partial [Pseudoxanthomonas sp.]
MGANGAAVAVTGQPSVAARDWRTPLELLLLGAIWGGSFLFMRVAAKPFGAFALVDIRLALGALV